jgi:hypothetical protein
VKDFKPIRLNFKEIFLLNESEFTIDKNQLELSRAALFDNDFKDINFLKYHKKFIETMMKNQILSKFVDYIRWMAPKRNLK